MTATPVSARPATSSVAGADVSSTTSPRQERVDDIAGAVFSLWTVIGLFIDGWAHNEGKPEDFFTPWHAVLYSGFTTGALWFGASRLVRARRGEDLPAIDPLVAVGLVLFAVAGVGDMAWHTVFGVEEDLEALLSPTHLLLMGGGLLLVTAPVRAALRRDDDPRSMAEFAPVAIGVTLAVAVVSFFLQFASAMHVQVRDTFGSTAREDLVEIYGVSAVLLANLVLMSGLAWVRGRWPNAPAGTATLLFGGTALLMAGLDGFDQVVLVLPFVVAGVLADVLAPHRSPLWLPMVAVPVVLWGAWFATFHAAYGVGWSPELWAGTIALAGLSGAALHLLAGPSREASTVSG